VEYHGGAFAGWQVQPDLATVQGALEQALATATGRPCRVEGAGRTDSGVHASGQVAAFDVAADTDLYRLQGKLNGLTPRAMSLRDLQDAHAGFDPRREATGRLYRYTLVAGRPDSPLQADRAWHVVPELDLELLSRLAALLEGTHDFAAFRSSDCGSESTMRRIFSSSWSEEAGLFKYEVRGNAFLRNMVRVMVGSMVDTALGDMEVAEFERLLEHGERVRAGRTAPSRGLELVAVDYDGQRIHQLAGR
jgi:tRNA pseudouridine38-40 synthase